MSIGGLSRDVPIERPESLRYLEAELEFLLGRVRSTGQRRVALLPVALRSLRPHPPTEALVDFWSGAAPEFDEVKQAALSRSGLLLAAEVSNSTAAAARRLRDLTRRLIDRAETTVPAADAALAVSEMTSHVVLQNRPEFVRLDVRVDPSTVWMQVHARCHHPAKMGRTGPECSNILMRRLAQRTGESRTLSRHRIWCDLRS